MELKAIREALRRIRDDKTPRMTLDDAADRSGINRATIHSIENTVSEPDYQPGLMTVLRLIAAYDLTAARFFADLESPPEPLATPPDVDSPRDGPASPAVGLDDGALPSDAALLRRLHYWLGQELANAKDPQGATSDRGSAPGSRDETPQHGVRRRRPARRHAQRKPKGRPSRHK